MTWFRYDAPLGCTINSRFAMVFSGEAATASSCGRQPADPGVPRTPSREAATAVPCCRRLAAPRFVVQPIRGLTPTAICCRRFAIESDLSCCHRVAIESNRRFTIKCDHRFAIKRGVRFAMAFSGEAATAFSCGLQPAEPSVPRTPSREAATAGNSSWAASRN